jgi:hypothetical protein
VAEEVTDCAAWTEPAVLDGEEPAGVVAAWAWREKIASRNRIPAAKRVACIARRATCRPIA